MSKRAAGWTIFVIFIIGLTIGIIFARWQQLPLHNAISIPIDQNANDYINKKNENELLIKKDKQASLAKKAIAAYFKPWDNNPTECENLFIKNDIKNAIAVRQKYPGWGINYQPNSQQWVAKITDNIDLNTFPNRNSRAIIIKNTELRGFPTSLPIFSNYEEAGQGYPFDNLQLTSLWVGQPIRVLQISKNGAWIYVNSSGTSGWISSRNIAFVSDKFAKQYRKNKFVAIIKDNKAIKDTHGRFRFMSRIGSIFPEKNNKIYIPIADQNQHAKMIAASIDTASYGQFPLAATEKNFAFLLNQLSGEPYAWGGFKHWRDCSLTIKSLFFTFGLYLPRSSAWQTNSATKVDLSNASTSEKLALIKKYAIPYVTLIGLNGHIMLYTGTKNGKFFVFHNKWGLHTKNLFGDEGRDIIGAAGFTTLTAGKNIPFISKLLIQKVNSMTLITNPKVEITNAPVYTVMKFNDMPADIQSVYNKYHHHIMSVMRDTHDNKIYFITDDNDKVLWKNIDSFYQQETGKNTYCEQLGKK